jgi:hypothetical protein
MVHIHTQSDFKISSSKPSAAIRKNLRGSISSSPLAGQPEEQVPQVRHRFKFPPSGRISMTLSINRLFFCPPNLIASSAIIVSLSSNSLHAAISTSFKRLKQRWYDFLMKENKAWSVPYGDIPKKPI